MTVEVLHKFVVDEKGLWIRTEKGLVKLDHKAWKKAMMKRAEQGRRWP